MRRFCQRFAVAAAAACGLLAASCGERGERLPETGATLEGTITFGSEPVPMAMVIVRGSGGGATGHVGDDGRYKVENVPLGEVKLAVNTDAARGEFMSQSMAASYKGPESKGKTKGGPKFVEVPKKYHDPETSGIKTTINKGQNTFDIVISK
jgi:hypothetical protein